MIELLFIMITLTIAGFAKGVVGLGLPPIAMGLLVIVMAPVEAATIMVLPALFTNLWQGISGPYLSDLLGRFWVMFVLTGLVTLTFASALSSQADIAIRLLGVCLFAYAVYSLKKPVAILTPRLECWLGPITGIATGLATAFTGVSSIPSVPFLQSVGLNRDALIQAMGVSFSISAIALVVVLGVSGEFTQTSSASIGAAIIAAFIGMSVGARLRSALNEVLFRQLTLWGLAVLGVYLLFR